YTIWEKVIEINSNVLLNVLTNGSILNDRVKKILEKGNFKISVSIDSLVKETYEKIRVNGNFEQVMSNIIFFQKLMSEKGHIMNFNLCVMRQNWKVIPTYFNFCNQNNIEIVLHTVEFANHCSLWNLSKENLIEIKDYYLSSVIENHNTIISKKNITTFNT